MSDNRSYLLFLWMRWKWATIAVLAGNVGAILAAVFGYWTDWLYVCPGLALILWKGVDAHRWTTAFHWCCRLCNYTTHFAPLAGKVTDGDLQAAQVFIRRYPWAMESVEYSMVPDGKDKSILWLKFGGVLEINAANAAKVLTADELSQLMKMCK